MRERFRQLCIEERLFTCGTCRQYEEVMNYLENVDCRYGREWTALVYMTWICSDTDRFCINEVESILHKLFI